MSTAPRTTRICGYDADTILIRGRNLVTELMGRMTFTEMILFQLTGNRPTSRQAKILDAVLVTIMEHGLVPSAIVSRLTYYGAPESIQGAVAAGLLGVGDRFAGTASECAALLEPIVQAARSKRAKVADDAVRQLRRQKRPVPGFGHTVHRKRDPRVDRLLQIVKSAGSKGDHLQALAALERAVGRAFPKKNLVTNVSAAIAVALGEAGIPSRAIRGIVLTARCAGLAGHVYEELTRPAADAMWHASEKAVPYEDMHAITRD